MKNKKVCITGGAGFVGSNLVKRLKSEENEVTIVDDFSNGHMSFLSGIPNLTVLSMDFADPYVLNKITNKEFDIVFHQAAIPRVSYSVEHPFETTDINVNRTVKLMEACIGNIERFVFASSSSVYGGADNLPTKETEEKKPVSPYAWHKSCIEDLGKIFYKLYGLDFVSLRYFNVVGPNQYGDSPYSTAVSAWCHAVKKGLPLRSDGDGEQTRDLCYVDNVVDANMIVANSDKKFAGECYNVACGERTSNKEILEFFRNRFPNIEVVHAPERAGDVKHTQADISKLTKLGYEPKVKFWEGLEEILKWWEI